MRRIIKLLVFVALCGIIFSLLTGSASAAVDFPADEAGICAYVRANESINLSAVKPALTTIERETENYIIGTVYLPWHSEVQYPHVYVSTDGWVVAFYPNDRSSGWLLPWYYYGGGAITTTTLDKVIETMCAQINGTATGLKYYDFRHPNATKMMIIVEDAPSSDWFKVTIPTNFATYRVDWSHQGIDRGYYDNSYAYLDGGQFSSTNGNSRRYGSFNLTTEFQNGIEHTLSISVDSDADARVGLVLEYAE
jgi:hypothetical protein